MLPAIQLIQMIFLAVPVPGTARRLEADDRFAIAQQEPEPMRRLAPEIGVLVDLKATGGTFESGKPVDPDRFSYRP